MKLMVMGYARHGKDTVCELLRDRYGFSFESSSYAAARLVVYPALLPVLGYRTIEDCYADRVHHRALWYELIRAYNRHDKARLIRRALAKHDVYCGVRAVEEFETAKAAGLFDLAVWVDASGRLPPELPGSCTVGPELADYVVNNNRSLADLEKEVKKFISVVDG